MSCICADFLFLFQRDEVPQQYKDSISCAFGGIQGPLQALGINLAKKGGYVGILASRYVKEWKEDIHREEKVGKHYVTTLKATVFGLQYHPASPVHTLFDHLVPERERLRDNARAQKRLWDEATQAEKPQNRRRSKNAQNDSALRRSSRSSGAPSHPHRP